jgi:hypothetical protein
VTKETDSPDCRTAIIDLSFEANVTFTFSVISNAVPAYNNLKTNDYIFNVTCGAEKQFVEEQSRKFIFVKD